MPPFAAQLLTLGPTIQILVSVLFSAANNNPPGLQTAVVVVLVARGGAPPLLCNIVAHLRWIKLLVGRTGRYLLWHVTTNSSALWPKFKFGRQSRNFKIPFCVFCSLFTAIKVRHWNPTSTSVLCTPGRCLHAALFTLMLRSRRATLYR